MKTPVFTVSTRVFMGRNERVTTTVIDAKAVQSRVRPCKQLSRQLQRYDIERSVTRCNQTHSNPKCFSNARKRSGDNFSKDRPHLDAEVFRSQKQEENTETKEGVKSHIGGSLLGFDMSYHADQRSKPQ
jgi:hypothetical protein